MMKQMFKVLLSNKFLPVAYLIFGLEYLNISQWIFVLTSAISIIPMCEIVKFFINNDIKLKHKFIYHQARVGPFFSINFLAQKLPFKWIMMILRVQLLP